MFFNRTNNVNKELQEILTFLDDDQRNQQTVLATVVDVNGSSYRLPGARMLISADGWTTVGTISGGCLEADVVERTKRVFQTGQAEVIVYDTRATDDSVFSLNMGCKGVIKILLEKPGAEFADFLIKRLQTNQPGVLATLISVDPKKRTNVVGDRLFFDQSGVVSSDFAGEVLDTLIRCTSAVLNEKQTRLQNTPIGEVFLEYVSAPTRLTIFGAGADAVSLVSLAKNVGWFVTVIDHRPSFAVRERFPAADEILLIRPENLSSSLTPGENTAAVVMTHNYEHDKKVLKYLAKSEVFYIGALGPKHRTASIFGELLDEDQENYRLSHETLNRLHAPIGLDIGGDTPELIAVSIIAEIQSVIKRRNGGFLRERKGSINGRNAHSALSRAASQAST